MYRVKGTIEAIFGTFLITKSLQQHFYRQPFSGSAKIQSKKLHVFLATTK